jgi:hypothetical protein
LVRIKSADNKRIRLAKDYLSRIEDEESEEDSEEEDRVASRLHREALENSDRLFKPAADRFKDLDLSDLPQRKYRGHQVTRPSPPLPPQSSHHSPYKNIH